MEEMENKIIPVEEKTEVKLCKYCLQELDASMSFCTRCGKSQEEEKVKRVVRIKKKRVKTSRILSLVSFLVSAVVMLYALVRMWFFNVATYSIFGTSYDGLIINQTVVISSLIISMMFLIFGMFLYHLKD